MSVERELLRRQRLRLTGHHTFPLKMSSRGGVAPEETLEIEEGTEVEVAEDCGRMVFDIPVHFVEESLKKHANGRQPFFILRFFLEETSAVEGKPKTA